MRLKIHKPHGSPISYVLSRAIKIQIMANI